MKAMFVVDPGHEYDLATLDGDGSPARLTFVKRVGTHYPGNEGHPHAGTTMQEVLRALIDRAEYVNCQIPCAESEAAATALRTALLLFEIRAKRVKGKSLHALRVHDVVAARTCPTCGHVSCEEHAR